MCPRLQDAEVFRTVKSSSAPDNRATAAGVKRTRGVAFGTGAADEDDSYGMMEDYVSTEADPRKGMLFEIAGDSDEEDLPYVMGRYILPHACKVSRMHLPVCPGSVYSITS